MSKDIFNFSWIPSSGTLFMLLNNLPAKSLVGAEIGVRTGSNLLHLLNNCNKIDTMIAIDPFCPYQDGDLEVTQEDQDLVKSILIHRIKKSDHSDKVKFLFKTSDDAVLDIEDESLDFIYIDGDHSEEAFKKDLFNYIKKVKVGGIVSGHDLSWIGVNNVLSKFLEENQGLDFLFDKSTDSWAFYKI